MERHPLLIVGAGGFGRETAETVRAINRQAPTWELLGFADDNPALRGTQVTGVPVLGPADEVLAAWPRAMVVVTIGSPRNFDLRAAVVNRLGLQDERSAVLIHPLASIGESCAVGAGSVLLAGAVATADVHIGRHVAVMPHVVLTHDDVVGDYATFGAGACLAGGVVVEEGAYIGSGASVREGRRIGSYALIGMGSVVVVDVPAREVWAGVPARRLRTAGIG